MTATSEGSGPVNARIVGEVVHGSVARLTWDRNLWCGRCNQNHADRLLACKHQVATKGRSAMSAHIGNLIYCRWQVDR